MLLLASLPVCLSTGQNAAGFSTPFVNSPQAHLNAAAFAALVSTALTASSHLQRRNVHC